MLYSQDRFGLSISFWPAFSNLNSCGLVYSWMLSRCAPGGFCLVGSFFCSHLLGSASFIVGSQHSRNLYSSPRLTHLNLAARAISSWSAPLGAGMPLFFLVSLHSKNSSRFDILSVFSSGMILYTYWLSMNHWYWSASTSHIHAPPSSSIPT